MPTLALALTLLLMFAPLTPAELHLAHIIEGEALPGICPLEASLVVAHVANNAPGVAWYGYATPGPEARYIARHWRMFPDPTGGANHLFSKSDVLKPAVKQIIGNRAPTWQVECGGGLGLRTFSTR